MGRAKTQLGTTAGDVVHVSREAFIGSYEYAMQKYAARRQVFGALQKVRTALRATGQPGYYGGDILVLQMRMLESKLIEGLSVIDERLKAYGQRRQLMLTGLCCLVCGDCGIGIKGHAQKCLERGRFKWLWTAENE